ncbi:uncharacterized protein B0H64DRAFT_8490 [Chaetomium fimeti]|uniref:Uncharacterized protein n=1 Tax=Chaetomium fimeti TaxID=1854472 RepID=A0AAE0LXC3_9PEZI|nr:hypothetical protein B0H64DRAFT_8490 [Chaetomium fimeti]
MSGAVYLALWALTSCGRTLREFKQQDASLPLTCKPTYLRNFDVKGVYNRIWKEGLPQRIKPRAILEGPVRCYIGK